MTRRFERLIPWIFVIALVAFLAPGVVRRESPEGRRQAAFNAAFNGCYERFYPDHRAEFETCLEQDVSPLGRNNHGR